ncbi:hypothetical protein GCM10009749_06410 [Agromyces neolithicus]|uniref:Uncharacterized protein n=1 Tax=Agromyces neolithicus TaxID=269420 RepID=A0ABN2LW45_9MICO
MATAPSVVGERDDPAVFEPGIRLHEFESELCSVWCEACASPARRSQHVPAGIGGVGAVRIGTGVPRTSQSADP